MTSRLQEPCQAGEQAPRRFVGFPFRLQPNPQPGGQRQVRRLDRQVMSQGEDDGLDGVESAGEFVGFIHLGRSVVRCDLMFDQEGES